MKKYFALLLVLLLILSGCKKNEETTPSEETNKINYTFKYEGKSYELGEVFDVDNYGEPVSYAEVASRVFEGVDKTYTYDHIEITTYPVNGEDKLYVLYFLDESVKTNEGIGISDTYEDMINTYGEDYYNEVNLYTYANGKKSVNFIVQNGIITSVEYDYAVN